MANHGGDMFIKALQDRFTCKRYAPEGHISDSDFNTILEAARLSPQDEKARLEMFQTFQKRDLRVLETCPQSLDPKRALFVWASMQP